MKILHVLNHSVPHTDGYCVRSANIVKFQRAMGWEPVVVTSPRQQPVPTEQVELIEGVRYYRTLPGKKRPPVLDEVLDVRRMQRRIEAVVRLEQPQIVHAHSPCSWGLAAAAAARGSKLPFVYEIRGVWEDGAVDQGRLTESSMQYRLRRGLESHVARRAAAVVTISAGLEREFRDRGAKHLFVVPNGVDLIQFNHGQHAPSITNGTGVTIGYIGSMYPWEGVEDLVRAAAVIREQEPGVRIRVVGDGETAQAIAGLVDQLSLSDTVELVGRVPHEKISDVYHSTDILVYPRRSSRTTELVTPLKPLEAMALEKPIVVSNVGGLLELVDDGSALVFSAGDSDDLANRCLELVRDMDLRRRLGQQAREHVHRHRDWSKIIQIYDEVYQHALASAGKNNS